MWGHEAAWLVALRDIAQLGQIIALEVHDADSRAKSGGLAVGADVAAQLTHVDPLVAAGVDEQAAGTGHVLPLGLELAVLVEDLHPLVLPVGHVDPAVLVGAHIVGDVELSRSGARLAPGEEQLAVR